MNSSRRLRFSLLAAVVLMVTAAVPWRSFAAPPTGGPAVGLAGQNTSAGTAAPASAAPVPGGPGFYSQSAFLFRPYVDVSAVYAYTGVDLYNPNYSTAYYEAPLWLPNGATVTKLVLYGWDSSSTEDIQVSLFRVGLDDASVDVMAQVSSAGSIMAYRSFETTSIAEPVIDQQSYAYVAEVGLAGVGIQTRFVGIRIDYAFPTNLPLVTQQ